MRRTIFRGTEGRVISPDAAGNEISPDVLPAKRYQEAIFGASRADRDAAHEALVVAGRIDEMRAEAESQPITAREAVVRLPAQSGGRRGSKRARVQKKRGTRVCLTCHLEGCHCAKRGPKSQYPFKFEARVDLEVAHFIAESGGAEFVRALVCNFAPLLDESNGFPLEQLTIPRRFISGVGAPKMTTEPLKRVHWSVDDATFARLKSLRAAAEARDSRFGTLLRWLVVGFLQVRLDVQGSVETWQSSSVAELRAICASFSCQEIAN